MSKTKFDELCNLTTGRFDWKIKVRIVRLWKGVIKKGEMFKGFNLILLDSKNNRMHAFVPANSVDRLEPKLTLGKVCVIKKFTVQDYKMEDKFRCLRNNVQLIFSNETQIKDVEDDRKSIEQNAFDFYDHSELKELTNQNTYLADVVGIIKYYQPLSDLVNRLGNAQKQVKFTITDGRSSVNVTFWDSFAENFDKQMNQVSEKPVIVIIASSRVGLWNDEVDLSSVGGTICYLNYNHYSVFQLRKKLTQPAFSQQMYAMDKNREVKLLNVAKIKSLGKDYIMRDVCAQLTIRSVDESKGWYSTVCTDCNQEIGLEEDNWFCHNCNRILPHPDKKFKVSTVAYDDTDGRRRNFPSRYHEIETTKNYCQNNHQSQCHQQRTNVLGNKYMQRICQPKQEEGRKHSVHTTTYRPGIKFHIPLGWIVTTKFRITYEHKEQQGLNNQEENKQHLPFDTFVLYDIISASKSQNYAFYVCILTKTMYDDPMFSQVFGKGKSI